MTSVVDGLKKLYLEKLKPLEVTYKFNDFVSPVLVKSKFSYSMILMLNIMLLLCYILEVLNCGKYRKPTLPRAMS